MKMLLPLLREKLKADDVHKPCNYEQVEVLFSSKFWNSKGKKITRFGFGNSYGVLNSCVIATVVLKSQLGTKHSLNAVSAESWFRLFHEFNN
jgi:hypothetical protein